MKPIQLEILMNNDVSESLQSLGIKSDFSSCDIEIGTFYTIDCVLPQTDREYRYCSVFSGGAEFICPMEAYQVNDLIRKNNL